MEATAAHYIRITSKGRGAVLASYIEADAKITGCNLYDAALSVQEAHKVSDDDLIDFVLPHLPTEEFYCDSCGDPTLRLDGYCIHCGGQLPLAVRNV